ncbi:MAG: efflux RND transporter periplasmic adaptor subunit [Limnohabitans sp.]|nr:efflux RND transporter periplasmic adaptor subunit [Limnohabitans sp.]
MRKLLIVSLSSLFFACGSKENSTSIDDLIKTKNITELKNKKAALEADLAKIDKTLSSIDKKNEEALVEVKTIKDTVFNHYLDIQGNIDTNQNILIQPEFSGTLVALNVKAGDKVTKGQILGRVDDAGMSQQLASVENQYNLAKTTFERQKNLWSQKIGSEIQYLQAQTQMISAQKAVAQMRAQVAKTIIKAPFTGTIDDVFVERGQVVAPSPQGLMRIVNLGSMYVSTAIPETYVGKVKVGTTVEASITSIGKKYNGKVRQVAKSINPANRSFGIEVSIPNPEGLLRPNQVAKLKIIDYSNRKATVVPSGIIQTDAKGNKFVFVVTDATKNSGVAKKAIVKIGQSADNATEILSGLSSNDRVVTEGANTISEGMKVNF